jgi:hypothetical protein
MPLLQGAKVCFRKTAACSSNPFPHTGEKHQALKIAIDYHRVWSPDGSHILCVPAPTSRWSPYQ